MALNIHKKLLHGFIQSMYDEGFVNDRFCEIQQIKEKHQPDYAVRQIEMYCGTAESLLGRLARKTKQAPVDFISIGGLTYQLYTKSKNIGAEHVKNACIAIFKACRKANAEKCAEALCGTKNEFNILRRKFQTVLKMERKILELKTARKESDPINQNA